MPTTPRSTKSITFSLPPEIGERVRHVMKEEGRTISKLIREAPRNYMEERVRQEAHRLNVPVVEPGQERAGGQRNRHGDQRRNRVGSLPDNVAAVALLNRALLGRVSLWLRRLRVGEHRGGGNVHRQRGIGSWELTIDLGEGAYG